MKALTDDMSLKLKAGSSTKDDKEYAQTLGRVLKESLRVRGVAEKAASHEVDTAKCLSEQKELTDMMRQFKSGGITSAERKRAGILKAASSEFDTAKCLSEQKE